MCVAFRFRPHRSRCARPGGVRRCGTCSGRKVLTSHSLLYAGRHSWSHGRVPCPQHCPSPRSVGARYAALFINRTYRDPRHIPVIRLRPRLRRGDNNKKGERMTELQSELPVRSDPFWPVAMITFGGSLTVAWVILLGYGLVRASTDCGFRGRRLLPLPAPSHDGLDSARNFVQCCTVGIGRLCPKFYIELERDGGPSRFERLGRADATIAATWPLNFSAPLKSKNGRACDFSSPPHRSPPQS